ncbi:ROK family protein, partial [Acinetobacter baumannii]
LVKLDEPLPGRGFRVGIDLGGTKIAGILLDADGETRAEKRIPAPRGDYEHTVRALRDLAADLAGSATSRPSIGIGMPGSV